MENNIKKYVENALVEYNAGIESSNRAVLQTYSYNPTHLNYREIENLEEAIKKYGLKECGISEINTALMALRDKSEVAIVDYNIRVIEPSLSGWEDFCVHFNSERTELINKSHERRSKLYAKLKSTLELYILCGFVPHKLLQQANKLLLQFQDGDLRQRIAHLKKTFLDPPEIELEGFTVVEQKTEEPILVDNSEFENNLNLPEPKQRREKSTSKIAEPEYQRQVVEEEEDLTEYPINELFVKFCEEINATTI